MEYKRRRKVDTKMVFVVFFFVVVVCFFFNIFSLCHGDSGLKRQTKMAAYNTSISFYFYLSKNVSCECCA